MADGNGLAVGAGVLVGTRVGTRVGGRTMGGRGVRMTRGVGVSVGSTTTVTNTTLRVGVTITTVGKTIGVFKTKGVSVGGDVTVLDITTPIGTGVGRTPPNDDITFDNPIRPKMTLNQLVLRPNTAHPVINAATTHNHQTRNDLRGASFLGDVVGAVTTDGSILAGAETAAGIVTTAAASFATIGGTGSGKGAATGSSFAPFAIGLAGGIDAAAAAALFTTGLGRAAVDAASIGNSIGLMGASE